VQRMLAIIERDLRRFRRSPMLIVFSLVFPLVQLVILGYAFGGTVRHLRLGVLDQDRGLQAVQLRELVGALASGPHIVEPIEYVDAGQALADLRDGRLNGVLTIPAGFSRRTLTQNDPRVAIIADNTDNFASNAMAAAMGGVIGAFNDERSARARQQVSSEATLDVVEVYPFVPYIQYFLPGSIVISIFMMVMVGGGIIFIDDKARGLHEGYLVTPITKLELILGFNLSGAIKAILAGLVVAIVGALIAGVPNPFEPLRLLRVIVVVVVTALALVSMMFLLMVRVTDPLLPRAVFGVLNTLLFFPSGAVYPQEGFPPWMRAIAAVDPFTYAVHAFKSVLLKNTGFGAIAFDLGYLAVFATVAMLLATALFKRTL
jgi:ABC-2 type transport system permease protein